jgi:AcrR family transcriptional regulator
MGMSIPYEAVGRTSQKMRTRAALVEAARALLAEGVTPTVEQAAGRADVARTTAYRYFPKQDSLLLAVYPELDSTSLLGAAPPADPAERLEIVTQKFTKQVVDHEAELRATLRVALDLARSNGPLPLRQGRAISWIEDALATLRASMSERELHKLALAIRVCVGIEAFVWLTDVGKLSAEEAVETMRSSARALLRCSIQDAKQAPGQASRPRKHP